MRRQESLLLQQDVGAKAEDLRVKGEMLLASATQIGRGQTEAIIDMLPGEPPLRIALDPLLTAIENAQDYFKRYAQARDAARSVPALLEEVALDLAYLDQLQLDMDLAQSSAEMREVKHALANAGKEPPQSVEKAQAGKKRPVREKAKIPPLTYKSADGMEIVVGRNARQNDYVTFELASSLDLWLHARGVAGSHVIVRSGPRPVSPQTLQQAAALAAAHSAARSSGSVAVDYVQRRNVHRARGGNPGLVTYLNEKTIHVRPALEK
jgi:predicted ribosome quality control (RQC) complex YloA/Tae2 family protein